MVKRLEECNSCQHLHWYAGTCPLDTIVVKYASSGMIIFFIRMACVNREKRTSVDRGHDEVSGLAPSN